MLKFNFDPTQMSIALTRLAAVPHVGSGKSSVELKIEMDNKLVVNRASRTESLSFIIPITDVEQGGMSSVVVEEDRFARAVAHGMTKDHSVEFKIDPSTSSAVVSQGKSKKFKIPTLRDTLHQRPDLQVVQGPHTCEWNLEEQDIASFFRSLGFASVFMADKIVGKGKFSGIVLYSNRAVACSYDGVSEAPIKIPFPKPIGIPISTYKILSLFNKEKVMSVVMNAEDPVERGIRSVLFDGVTDGDVAWGFKFEMMEPSLSFLGHDLSWGPSSVSDSPDFVADFKVENLFDAVKSVSSILEKNEAHLEITKILPQGIALRAVDSSGSAESTVNVAIMNPHRIPDTLPGPIRLSRTFLSEILYEGSSGTVTLTFDTKHPHQLGVCHKESMYSSVLAMVSMGNKGN